MFIIVELLLAILTITYLYWKWKYQLFKRRGVPYIEPIFPVGSTTNTVTKKENIGLTVARYYYEFRKQGHTIGGIFLLNKPIFVLCHPETIKRILTTDFQHFTDHDTYVNERDDPITGNVFSLNGSDWRKMRVKLTPTFTSGKMKIIYPLLSACCDQLVDSVRTLSAKNEAVDIKQIFVRYGINVIGTCAFGLECEDSGFRKIVKKLSENNPWTMFKQMFASSFPDAARFCRIRLINTEVLEFFLKIVGDTVAHRRNNNVVRNDFLQLLMKLQDEGELTLGQMVAQCVVFFFGGFESSSTLAMYCMYALSKHPDIQEKVRQEVQRVIEEHDGQLPYNALHELKYLDCVLEETLRRYPVGYINYRKCTRDWKDPDTGVVIKTGEAVMIPKYGMFFDAEYFPEPEKFDPDRFNEENKRRIIPFTYLPFGEGPRNCIGMRFGLMQTKSGIAQLLNKFRFAPSERTEEPLIPVVNGPTHKPRNPIFLNVEEL